MKKIKVVVEMPAGSFYKYEIDKDSGNLRLDRPLNQKVPQNYGYVPDTLQKDGDPLDVFVLSYYPIPAKTEVEVEIIGVLKCTDNGVEDDKLLSVLYGEERLAGFEEESISRIATYLSTYKEGFVIDGYENAGQAVKTYELSRIWPNPAD